MSTTNAVVMTEIEWNAEGVRRFGPDRMKWRFVCPICKHVATPEDFRKFKDAGANPNSATCECIGRYMPRADVRQAFGENGGVTQPCDYAGYGLLHLSPVVIQRDGVSTTECFAFAEPEAA